MLVFLVKQVLHIGNVHKVVYDTACILGNVGKVGNTGILGNGAVYKVASR